MIRGRYFPCRVVQINPLQKNDINWNSSEVIYVDERNVSNQISTTIILYFRLRLRSKFNPKIIIRVQRSHK